jgi:aminoglycoside 3-N-acetyltransferase
MPVSELEKILEQSYEQVNAYEADIIYMYTDFRYFGQYASEFKDRDDFCNVFASPFLLRGKTIILTTFTYTSEGKFDVLSTRTNLGAMNKWILDQPGYCRSEHPLFSYAALGPQAYLVENIGKSAFGYDSIFERLKGRRAVFLHVGRPVYLGNTALHYVEQMCGATYRVQKAFRTKVYRGDKYIGTDYSANLRRRDVPDETFEFDFTKAAEKLYTANLIRETGSSENLSNVSVYRYDETIECLYGMFYKDPRIFIKSDFIGY